MHPVGCVISSALPHAPCFSRVVTPNSTLSWRFSQPRSTDFWRQRILGCGGCPGHYRAMPVAPSVWQTTMLPGICQMSPGGKESALAETVWGLGLLSTPPIQAQTPASPQHTQNALARDLPPETGVCSTLRTRKGMWYTAGAMWSLTSKHSLVRSGFLKMWTEDNLYQWGHH